MANTIRIKRSTGSSAPTSLANAELAISESNQVVYIGIGTGGAGGSATSVVPIGGKGKFIEVDTSRTANTFLSAPDGSAGSASFRAMVADDVPSLLHTKISDFDTGVRTNRLNEMTAPNGAVSFSSQKITNLADPTADADAANKGYVDGVAQGLDIKDSVVATTTANITISGTQTIDGVSLSAGNRVLVKDQSTQTENGIYICAAGSWSRADDLAAGGDAAGAFVFVEQGTVNAENGFVCTSNKGSAVVGTNNLVFAQFSGAGQIIAGNGMDKSGNTLSVDLKSNGGLVIESTEIAVNLSASSITGTLAVSDGGTGATGASGARTNLGLVIGTDVEPHSDKLTELATMAQNTADSLADLTNSEVQILDGAVVTTTELNIIDGNTSATSTTLAQADRFVCNDAGTMKQVALSDLVTFLENESVSGFNIDGGSY
ncbi:phage-related tail fiber protein [uncultured Mediterranean phage uvMED]|nr:phage-related tail fiber protein [uncultured Mediterranean phage uvMED]